MTGNDIVVYKGSTIIGMTRSCEIQSKADTIEVASSSSGAWKEHIASRKEWSLSVSWLIIDTIVVTDPRSLHDLLSVGTTYTLLVKKRGTSDTTGVSGDAILTTCQITATRGNLIQGSFQFQGISALAIPT